MDNTNKSFAAAIFEILSGKVPTEQELKVFELILSISIDHGPETPSAVKVIEAAEEGKPIGEAIAAGMMEINDRHGGAVEPAMEFFYQIQKGDNAEDLVSQYLEEKKIIGGYGHRIYKDLDPRTEIIFKALEDAGFNTEFKDIAKSVESAIENKKGVKLPLNIDGAIAVVLCTFGWNSNLGKAVFIAARAPGLCHQYLTKGKDQQ